MIEIRRAAPEEADILTEIALSAKRHWDYPESWIETWTPLLTFKPEDVRNADVFCAVIDGQIAGFYRLSFREGHGILEDLWVRPEYIRKGIGRSLFEHAVHECRTAGLGLLEVEADPHAQGFYEKMGMHKVREHRSAVDGQRNLPILEMEL